MNNFNSVIIDPLSHNNNRTEFKIANNKLMLSTLRLSNFGLIADIDPAYNYTYDSNAGIYSMIKNIYLYDGGVMLDSLNEVQSFMAFSNQNNTNDKSVSNNQQLVANLLGFSYDLSEIRDGSGSNVSVVDIEKFTVPDIIAGSNIFLESSLYRYEVNKTNYKATGYIDLSRCLNFLKQIIFLDTNIFTNLRVVIEYNDLINSAVQYNVGPIGVGTYLEAIRPILIYDEITDEETIKTMKKNSNRVVLFNPIELIKVPFTVNNNVLSELDIKLNGFNSKYVNRIAIIKKLYSDYRQSLSPSLNNEIYNFVFNGRKIYPYDVDTKNKRLSYLVESWGNFCYLEYENDGNNIQRLNNFYLIQPIINMNTNDYIGSVVQKRVEEFIFNYSVNSTIFTGNMNFLVYGEIQKQIIINNNSYIIKYV